MRPETYKALNKLVKWRSVFAGWQLGTRPDTDPECQAVRDHREVTLLLRAEVSALIATLAAKDPDFLALFEVNLGKEAEMLSADYEGRFRGFTPTTTGMRIDVEVAKETMKGWKP